MDLDVEHNTKIYDMTACRAIQTTAVAIHAVGSDTGSSLMSWVLNCIETSVDILWDSKYSMMSM